MGGTFDPIHNGHLVAASEVAHLYDLDEVVFRPDRSAVAEDPPRGLRRRRPLSDGRAGDHQQPAVQGEPDRHRPTVGRPTPSIRCANCGKDYPGAELFFITGADALTQIFGWHAVEDLFGLAHFVGVTRPGYRLEVDSRFPDGRVSLLEIPALAISSSDVRARVGRGAPVWYLVPDGVVRYISKDALSRRVSRPIRLPAVRSGWAGRLRSRSVASGAMVRPRHAHRAGLCAGRHGCRPSADPQCHASGGPVAAAPERAPRPRRRGRRRGWSDDHLVDVGVPSLASAVIGVKLRHRVQ